MPNGPFILIGGITVSLLLARSPALAQPCDDRFACTVNDRCEQGRCVGAFVQCPDDGDPCTREFCESASGRCVSAAETCDGKCLTGECDPATGCVRRPDDTPCNDEDTCTTGDRCVVGVCAGTAMPDGESCSDRFGACTENDRCVNGHCSGSFLQCDDLDRDGCTPEFCRLSTGRCISLPRMTCNGPCVVGFCRAANGTCPTVTDGTRCDDGNECTENDYCFAGECVGDATNPNPPTATPSPLPTPSPSPQPPTNTPVPTNTAFTPAAGGGCALATGGDRSAAAGVMALVALLMNVLARKQSRPFRSGAGT